MTDPLVTAAGLPQQPINIVVTPPVLVDTTAGNEWETQLQEKEMAELRAKFDQINAAYQRMELNQSAICKWLVILAGVLVVQTVIMVIK